MALKEMAAQKYREVYSQRRLEDKANFGGELTQPVKNTFDASTGERSRDIEKLPLMTETQLDVGEFLGRLNIKEFDGPVVGQTLHREELLGAIDPAAFAQSGMVVAPQTRSIWGYSKWNAYGTYGGRNAADTSKNFLTTQDAFTLYTKDGNPRVAAGNTDIASISNNEFAQIVVAGKESRQYNSNLKIELQPTIPKAWYLSGVSEPQTGHLRHRWTPQKGSAATGAALLTGATVQNLGIGDGLYPTAFDASESTAIQDTAPHNELILDYVSQSLVHSSALSFLYQYRTELESIASQTQYLSSELVGFYEKGLKGDFLRYWSKSEISLMFALVELGAAVRRQALVRNAHAPGISGMNADNMYLSGTFNPFFAYVDSIKSKDSSGQVTTTSVKRMYTPWWLTMLMDRHYFEYDSAVDDVRDIHREDLFQGVRLILEAASMEYGMMTASAGRPYLDFFDDFMSAGLRDFTVMDDVKTLRSLMMAGYEHAESFNNFGSTVGGGYEYFKDFLTSNRIAETVRLDHQKNMEELDRLSVMTGDMFKLGQQMMGDFEYTDEHRLTRFGSKSVDVRFKPVLNWRPLSYQWVFNSSVPGAPHTLTQFADHCGGPNGSVGSLRLDQISTATLGGTAVGSLDPSSKADWLKVLSGMASEIRDFTAWIAFPRLTKGLASLTSAGSLDYADPFLGYGNIRVNTTNSSNVTYSPLVSTATTPDKYGFQQLVEANLVLDDNYVDLAGSNIVRVLVQPVALAAPYQYWNLGDEGLFPGLIRSLNKVYQAWQGRTSGLFRRSELKNLLSFTTYNIARELKMNTPDAYLQKNAKNILGMMGCGASGYSPGFMVRKINRKLGDVSVHARSSTGVFGSPDSVETDVDLLFSPYVGEATEIEDMFFAQHLLGMFCGLYGHDFYSLKLPGSYSVTDLTGGVITAEIAFSGAIPYPIVAI